jgi:pimeloyl-ACP methyl ester carboxylesterase
MTLETRRIDIDGLVFDVDVAGPAGAPLVLLLHGYPQSKFAWRHELPALAAAGYRAAAPNQRGYSPGARPAEVRDYAIKHLVGDILQFADKLDADRFHLVGHDWGGALAWVAASWYPERLRSLTVLSRPHPDAFGRAMRDDPDQAQRSRHHKAFQDPATERLLLEDGARRLRESLARNRVPSEAIEAYLETLGGEAALGAALNWYRAAAGNLAKAHGSPKPLGAITVPTLYIWGEEDASVGPMAAGWTADHVEGPYTFHKIAGVGHFITDERPAATPALLLSHLQQYS